MSVNVNLNNVMGYVDVFGSNGKCYKCEICESNCLFSVIYTDDDNNKQL